MQDVTPLMIAASNGRIDLCEVLLKGGADPRAEDSDGATAWHWAQFEGHAEAARFLASVQQDGFQDVQLTAQSVQQVEALDLSRDPEEVLAGISIGQVLRGAAVRQELRVSLSRSRLWHMPLSDFLADDDGERHVMEVPGIRSDDFLELSAVLNAFATLVLRECERAKGAPRSRRGQGMSPPIDIESPTPDEILQRTPLAQIVVTMGGGPRLRRAMARSDMFAMSAADFLANEDGEAVLREATGLDVQGYFELSDLVNEFTAGLHLAARRR